jgi:cell division protein FtsQ
MNPKMVTPVDVKLMNLTVVVLVLVFVALCAVASVRMVTRSSQFDIRGITVTGDTRHNNSVTLRANVAPRIVGTFFTVDLARVRDFACACKSISRWHCGAGKRPRAMPVW